MEDIVHRNSDEDIKQLMERFSVSEEAVHVAMQIVGENRLKVERYLENSGSSRPFNLW